jgi:hypothetical protein
MVAEVAFRAPTRLTTARGWRRIGVVLSVMWLVGFGAYLWVSSVGQIDDFYAYQFGSCYRIANSDNDRLQYIEDEGERLAQRDANLQKQQRCEADALDVYTQQYADLRQGVPVLIAIDLGTVAFSWFMAWFIVLVVRWIRRGFVPT